MSLQTPIKIRELQRKLYTKAKQEAVYRFYLLYDKIHRQDVLAHAYEMAKANRGAPGVDGETFDEIESAGREGWLTGLRQELVQRTYRAQAVRRVMIPKPNGGERPLGIPTIRDRVVQTAAKLILDRHVLHLIRMWLDVAVAEQDEKGNWRHQGSSGKGTPQGGVISPLLANLYMNRFLKYWRLRRKGEQWRAHIVAYADDFVILSRGYAAEARDWTQTVMERIGLTLNERKTCIRDARREEFDFLGYTFGRRYSFRTGKPYLTARPSKKSIQRFTEKVYDLLRPCEKGAWPEVCDRLNAQLRGWGQYFRQGTVGRAYQIVNGYVERRVRNFLRQRAKLATAGTRRFSSQMIYGRLGVLRLTRARTTACAS